MAWILNAVQVKGLNQLMGAFNVETKFLPPLECLIRKDLCVYAHFMSRYVPNAAVAATEASILFQHLKCLELVLTLTLKVLEFFPPPTLKVLMHIHLV